MKEVTVETDTNVGDWSSPVLTNPDVSIKTLKCRPYGKNGMIRHVEVMSRTSVRPVLRAIGSEKNVSYSTFTALDNHKASGVVVTRNSPVCRALSSVMGFCSQCWMSENATNNRAKWHMTFTGNASLKHFLAILEREGIDVSVTELGNPTNRDVLTMEQDRSIRLAAENGYFRFPRQTSLRQLSKVLGIAPSTLDEILRRAEGKIISDYFGRRSQKRRGPNQELGNYKEMYSRGVPASYGMEGSEMPVILESEEIGSGKRNPPQPPEQPSQAIVRHTKSPL